MSKASATDIQQSITDQVIEILSSGEVPPWKKPWTGMGGAMPFNFSTNAPYNGVNILILWLAAMKMEYSSNAWMTFKQAKALGGSVRKGEKGVKCIFFKPLLIEQGDDEKDDVFVPCRRVFTLFNLDQVDGLESKDTTVIEPAEPDLQAQAVIDQMNRYCQAEGISVTRHPDTAGYSVMRDSIVLPSSESFFTPGDEAVTFAHEVVHATGHPSRLGRMKSSESTQGIRKGTPEYAFEELVAELGASFICAAMGVEGQLVQHASYIDSWLEALGKDKSLVAKAAAAASKAHALILPPQLEDEPEEKLVA